MSDQDVREPGPVVTGAIPTEDELVVLALAARPMTVPAEDAVPMAAYLGGDEGLLPDWYMPTPTTRVRARWRLPVVLGLVAVFLVLEALGLCSTFGHVVPA
ncbi:MAG TPA: hypothetical protein VND44_12440 [Acidimicrobiales bacterium]|nr:hypothetical protein [Acidimicrobiales bacterium]